MNWPISAFYGCIKIERKHPLEGGVLRRKYRRDRRPDLPLENPLVFYSEYLGDLVRKGGHSLRLFWQLWSDLKQVRREPPGASDRDIAMQPVDADDMDQFDMYTATEAARISVDKFGAEGVEREKAQLLRKYLVDRLDGLVDIFLTHIHMRDSTDPVLGYR